jgi:hypothetical protein
VYIYCGPDIDEAFSGNRNLQGHTANGNLGKPLQVSAHPHFLSLTTLKDGSTINYRINTHAFDGRGAAAYGKGKMDNQVYHKDTTGSQNTEEAWKFEEQCDDNAKACYKWKINAVNAHSDGYYMRAKQDDPHLYLETIGNSNDIEEFLWTIELH